MALWISLPVRRRFGLEELLPERERRIRPAGLEQLRRLAGELGRTHPGRPDPLPISAGELLALSLLEERAWERLANETVSWREELRSLRRRFGTPTVDAVLQEFERAFGVPDADGGDREEHAAGRLRELAVLWALERHPAAGDVAALLHEGRPEPSPLFDALVEGTSADPLTALADLLAEAAAAPSSLGEAVRWLAMRPAAEGGVAEAADRSALLLAADVLTEEHRPAFAPPDGAAAGAGELEAPRDWEPAPGPPRYGADPPWAPELVVIAKQLPVWLRQLGVERLDEIPDPELARLALRGFTGLWLVGIWERSRASRWIKQLCGNPEATASAYSIREYAVAADLGGEEAMTDLRERAAHHGIRLVADMVPNHMGLDSPWVLDHPERFLALPEPPFPSYAFSGPDLSPRPEDVRLCLEDHYYDATDAAVVFERLDRRTGERRYLYHGNDGTGLPWNDTAQLDYRRADVREAVIETILSVARRFPVVRFDAAMTLTWKHFRRLWFPAPGEGGAIPSRAGHGVSERALRQAMPREFWAEVVDRVEREAPDTLLLAEAFWLMEAHFARGLGVHRVYNSAFVNCLRRDAAAELRRQIADLLRLDPRLLERQVNYLSNPDEAPVREVFGDGPRWRAASILLATLPGTPLFAHGQVEGLRERYGMEYQRAYREDPVDAEMVAWHQRVLAPLLARRRCFSGSTGFRLLELRGDDGGLLEEVLAFANGAGEDLHVVVVNLSARPLRGVLGATGQGGRLNLRRSGLASWLAAGCRDLVGCRRLEPLGAEAGGRPLTLLPWEAMVLTGFEAPRRQLPAAPPVHPDAPPVDPVPQPGPPVPPERLTAGASALAAAVALGVVTLVGIERWLAGAAGTTALLLGASAIGWTALAWWTLRRAR